MAAALDEGKPVVALETAVATHGLPPPQNVEAMAHMVRDIEAEGAGAAICLVLDGLLCVGASLDQVERAARAPDREKASARDLGFALHRDVPAGLTVAATLLASTLVGIRVFATGGIGGVHVGAGETGDVSADLYQLSRSSVITVCAGVKSILDVPRTLEYLETLGVPVYAYGTDDFPAFFLSKSGVCVEGLDSPAAVAKVASIHWGLGSQTGIVLGNPLPTGEALSEERWTEWLALAEAEARREGISGKQVTPFLLDRVARYSEGETVRANLALLRRNARLAAQVAVALGT